MSEQHNGWTNFETWMIQLWIMNDESVSGWYEEVTQELISSGLRDSRLVLQLADIIEEDHRNRRFSESSVFADMILYSLGRVNWCEVSEIFVNEALKPNERIKLVGFKD
jgi:hypothetical protein